MRLRGRAGVWLALALCAVAAISASLALGLQERGLRRDLAQVTREHLDRARAVSARLLHLHLVGALRRYRASAQTPELRANLELGHAPTLEYFAEQLAAQQGAKALAFLNAGRSVAGAGDDALAKAALARRAELGVDPGACAPADAWVCADTASDGTAFPLAHRGRLHAVALVTLRVGPRSLGQLLAVEEIGPAALAEWAELVQAHIAIQSAKPGPLSALVRDLGRAQLRVEVSGDAERLALLNARRDLITSGAIALLLAFAASVGLSRALLRPIRRIGEVSRRIRAGDLSLRLHSPRRDELGEVERAFDAMLDRIAGALDTLQLSEARLARAQQLAALGSFSLEVGTGRVQCSAELRRICGLDATEPLDLPTLLENCVHPDDQSRVRAALERCMRDGTPLRLDHRTRPVEGAARLVHAQAERIERDGQPAVVEGTLQDVTERKLVEEQVRYLADHDSVTGLGNRRLFVQQIEVALGESRLGARGFSVLVLGLDDFQRLGDTLGPSWSDRALEQVAERLARVARATGSARSAEGRVGVARLGGDEFALLSQGTSGPADAASLARRVLRAFASPFALDGREVAISASLGIASYPGDGTDAESLLRNASAALHDAKQRARGTYQFYDESMNALAFKRLVLETGLRRALDQRAEGSGALQGQGGLQLQYQPKLELASGRVRGVEALMRWRDPELGVISPGEFIPVAEETGLIRELGAFALRSAVDQAAAWRGTKLEPVCVAVNVSGSQLDGAEFEATLERTLAHAGIDPAALTLEITESVLLSDPQGARGALERVAALGVRIALDDFGTGFSSLSYLRELPIHELKIDRSFVHPIATDERSAALLGAIAGLARVLHVGVTVEGVETEAQMEIVRELGCDEIQGYVLSPAVDPADLPRVVAEIERGESKRGIGS